RPKSKPRMPFAVLPFVVAFIVVSPVSSGCRGCRRSRRLFRPSVGGSARIARPSALEDSFGEAAARDLSETESKANLFLLFFAVPVDGRPSRRRARSDREAPVGG